jgi:hypothetical protein
MKINNTFILVVISSMIIFSCGKKKSKDIVVSDLKDACDCLEAEKMVAVEMTEILKPYNSGTEAFVDTNILNSVFELSNKRKEIRVRCFDELNVSQARLMECQGYDEVDKMMKEVGDKLDK